jgi:hypothetical protein
MWCFAGYVASEWDYGGAYSLLDGCEGGVGGMEGLEIEDRRWRFRRGRERMIPWCEEMALKRSW